MADTQQNTSIKQKLRLFSIILFLVIFIGGSIGFTASMWQNIRTTTHFEMAQSVEIERIKLEASVNSEIAIAIKMAGSPLIQSYFMNPSDSELEKLALEEIEGYRQAFRGKTCFWVNDIDHKFYSDDAYVFTMDVNHPDNYWYLMTLNETEVYNFNINYNPDLDVTNLWINAPVFNKEKKPVGILGTGIDISAFIDSIYSQYVGESDLYFFNSLGEITGAHDSSLVANKATLEQLFGALGTEVLIKAEQLTSDDIITFSSPDGEVALGKVSALDWYVVDFQKINLSKVLSSSMTFVFLSMMAVIAVIFIVFYIMISWMLKPLNEMITTLDNISKDWDLTQQIRVKHKDEIGQLGNFFNLTFSKMKDLILKIKNKTVALTDTGDELASHMIKTRSDIEGINNTIQNMRGQILTQSDKVNATANSMDSIIKGLTTLNDNISTQTESVSQSSSAIEEMIANIQSVTQTLVKNTQNINSLSESSELSRTDLQKVSTDIQEIAQESESLLQINLVMQTIASQTNLLSMNAAIEAAHAGESGKGFAVVADEIRKLAENSTSQSKTISTVLKKIKSMIDTITQSTAVVMERFSAMEKEVETVSNQESQIRNAMEEQGAGSRQILEAMSNLNSITGLVSRTSNEMTEESKDIIKHSSELKQLTGEVAENMDNMGTTAEQIVNTITRVQEISEENKENITELSADVKLFKVE